MNENVYGIIKTIGILSIIGGIPLIFILLGIVGLKFMDVSFGFTLIGFIILIIIIMNILWMVTERKNPEMALNDKDYRMKDFGEFKTKMHKNYLNSFNEYIPDISITNCKVKTFEYKSEPLKKVEKFNVQEPLDLSKYTHVEEERTTNTIIKITYFEFLTENDHNSNEDERKNMVKYKDQVEHYCKGNIHIIFEAYSETYSPYYKNYTLYKNKLDQVISISGIHLGNLRRIASHYVELK